MRDFEEIPVETSVGERGSTAVSDRLLIGLALTALLAGGLIALGNLLGTPGEEPVAAASPSADAHDAASATARPTPSPRPLEELTVEAATAQDMPERLGPPWPMSYWLVADTELVVSSAPGAGALELGHLAAGTVALARERPRPPGEEEVSDWFAIESGPVSGYVRVRDDDGDPLASLYPVWGWSVQPGGVSALAAGPTGFVAHGWLPNDGSEEPPAVSGWSADGEVWRTGDPLSVPGWSGVALAFGPSGWLGAARIADREVWIFESPNGTDWFVVGRLGRMAGQWVQGLVASDLGYLMVVGGRPWFSPDGITWRETPNPFPDHPFPAGGPGWHELRVQASESGFVAWIYADDREAPAIAISHDGRTWHGLAAGEEPLSRLTAATAGDVVLALGVSDGGSTRVWRGSLAASSPAGLTHASEMEVAFENAVVTTVTTDGPTALALGWDRATGASLAWRSDGTRWWRLPLPESGFGGYVTRAAGGPRGVVVATEAPPADPGLWHLRTDGTAARVTSFIAPASVTGPEDCGPAPDSALEFAVLDAAAAVECHGDEPFSFTAWSTDCYDCRWTPSGDRKPAWLMSPPRTLFLLPVEVSGRDSGYAKQAVLHPGMEWSQRWIDAWVRVTGHYDDPAARHCTWVPGEADEPWYPGPDAVVGECRRTFVVTRVQVVDGA